MDKETMHWLRKVAESSGEGIEKSKIFLSIFSKSYKEEPECALQLGIAVLLDKPIYLVVPHGVEIPENIKRLAKGFEYFEFGNEESLKAATLKLIERFTQGVN